MNSLRRMISSRNLHTSCKLFREKPENLKGKKLSSQMWITRQLRDPYVELAKQENYRCRSAFKLLEINEKYNFLTAGAVVIDCGAAPGSWTQVAAKLTNADAKKDLPVGTVLGLDILPLYPVEGATVLGNMDFTTKMAQDKLMQLLDNKKADVVLSDMAPNATGMRDMDHDNIIRLAYSAMKFALHVTRNDGTFLTKVWDGGKCNQLEQDLLRFFKNVKIVRPRATRSESAEKFFIASGFKGLKSASANIS